MSPCCHCLLFAGLRRQDSCPHGKQKCERCPERSYSQLTARRAQKAMTRSCSEGAYSQRCGPPGGAALSQQHADPVARVHSMDVSMAAAFATTIPRPEILSSNRLSPTYSDDDYNVPYNSPANLPCQQPLDVVIGGSRGSKRRPLAPPKRYCRQEDVTSEEPLTDTSGSSQDSPVKEEDLLPSQTSCQVCIHLHIQFVSIQHAQKHDCRTGNVQNSGKSPQLSS